jgi:hypothetical protein
MEKKRQQMWRWTVTADSDWQETGPTSRQRGRPTETREQISDRISGRKSQSGSDTKTYWLTVSHNVTSAWKKVIVKQRN